MNFHGDDVIPSVPEQALFHIIPVPFEQSVSYGSGTSNGPNAILEASCQLELFDGKNIPADYGLFTQPSVDCAGETQQVLKNISSAVTTCLNYQKIPVVLGGEHTVTVGAIEALQQQYGDFGVIQFDAHADLRDEYEGAKYSHACVMKRILDKKIPFIQVGTRSYSYEEQQIREQYNIPYYDSEFFYQNSVEQFTIPPHFPDKVFITFDIDGLDSGIMPATGTPVPGGLSWYHAMWIIEKIMNQRVCIGFDIVELAPINGFHSADFTTAQLTYNMMGMITRSDINKKYWDL